MMNNLFKLRQKSGVTQQKLCEGLKKYGCVIDRSTYSKYETGDRAISCEMLIVFAKYFETTTDYILGLTKND